MRRFLKQISIVTSSVTYEFKGLAIEVHRLDPLEGHRSQREWHERSFPFCQAYNAFLIYIREFLLLVFPRDYRVALFFFYAVSKATLFGDIVTSNSPLCDCFFYCSFLCLLFFFSRETLSVPRSEQFFYTLLADALSS